MIKKVIYFTGNSLGLQPKRTRAYVDEVMDDCKPSGRRTFYAEKPWWDYHERLAKPLGKIMGHCHLKLL
jgi:kynureninase